MAQTLANLILNLGSLYQRLSPHLSALKADDTRLKAKAIAECIALVSSYRKENKAEFDSLLDTLDELSHLKKDEFSKLLEKFL